MKQDKILYDSNCNLCCTSVKIIEKLDTKNKYDFISLESDEASKYISKKEAKSKESIILVNSKDNLNRKSNAIINIFSNLNLLFKPMIVLKIIPRGILDYLYDIIARNRYKWFGTRKK